MASLDENLQWNDTIAWNDSAYWYETPGAVVTDTAAITDLAIGFTHGAIVFETAVITTPVPTYSVWTALTDYASLTSYASISVVVSTDVAEPFSAASSATAAVRKVQLVTDTAVITDSIDLSANYARVVDTAVITSTVQATFTLARAITESAIIVDRAVFSVTANVTDTAAAADSAIPSVRASLSVLDPAVITSAITATARFRAEVLELFRGVDSASTTATLRENAVAEAFIASYISGSGRVAVGNATDAWTANTVNWAMSRLDYSAVPITGGSTQYATSPEGLFKQSTEFANFVATTGAADFGVPVLKSMQAVYTYGTHDAPMTISVTADVAGEELMYDYVQMARSASEHRGIRTDTGRGLKSTYYQLSFQPTGYADILYCEPRVEPLRRRI